MSAGEETGKKVVIKKMTRLAPHSLGSLLVHPQFDSNGRRCGTREAAGILRPKCAGRGSAIGGKTGSSPRQATTETTDGIAQHTAQQSSVIECIISFLLFIFNSTTLGQ